MFLIKSKMVYDPILPTDYERSSHKWYYFVTFTPRPHPPTTITLKKERYFQEEIGRVRVLIDALYELFT